MTPKITFADFMRCKKKDGEKNSNFISHYQSLYSQIGVKISNSHLQRMFIESLQSKIRDKIFIMKCYSFIHLCNALHDYQNSVSSHDTKPTSSYSETSKSTTQNNYQHFKRQKKSSFT